MPEVARIVTGALRENTYVVAGPADTAVVIDPGDDAERIAEYLSTRKLRLLGVLVTHAHADHIAAAVDVAGEVAAPICMHSADTPVLRRTNFARVLFREEAPIRIPSVGIDLADRERLLFEDLEVRIIHTPGHTPGSVCFAIGDALFTGDTILAGHLGHTDLPEADGEALISSLERLGELFPAMTVIHPGHGEPTSLGAAMRAVTLPLR